MFICRSSFVIFRFLKIIVVKGFIDVGFKDHTFTIISAKVLQTRRSKRLPGPDRKPKSPLSQL
jgi:hypothetical protein